VEFDNWLPIPARPASRNLAFSQEQQESYLHESEQVIDRLDLRRPHSPIPIAKSVIVGAPLTEVLWKTSKPKLCYTRGTASSSATLTLAVSCKFPEIWVGAQCRSVEFSILESDAFRPRNPSGPLRAVGQSLFLDKGLFIFQRNEYQD